MKLRLLFAPAAAFAALALPIAQSRPAAQTAPLAALASDVELVGERAVVERIVELGREEPRVQEHLHVLTARYGPRLTGSPLIHQAQEWARAVFESYGLEARLEPWGEWPVGFWRGAASGRVVSPRERALEFVTPAWSAGTLGPVRGRAVLAPRTGAELEALRPQLAGAFVVEVSEGRDERRAREEEAGDGDARVGREALRELARAFDAACDEAGVRGSLRAGPSDGRLITSGSYRVDPDALPTRLSITLLASQHEELVAELRAGEEVVLEFDVDNRFVPGPVTNHNVVADLVGSERPEEYVIVQAHIDAWDGATGTCDNGTGVATTLEAARLLTAAGARPKRTIRFVLYSGEEQGLHGSRGYVEAHADEMERVSIVLNHDEGTNHLKGIQATPAMKADFERVFAPVKRLDPERPFEVLEVDGLRQTGASDHASFIAVGVPAFHWIQDGTGYRHVHHTQYDTFDAAIPEEQEHSALVVALAAYGFAELEGLVDRTRMSPPPPRRMGVMLEGNTVTRVTPRMKAAEAGWKDGDVILSIDGVPVSGRDDVVAELQKGGPQKRFVLKRGEETLETVLDYGDDPGEEQRSEGAPDGDGG